VIPGQQLREVRIALGRGLREVAQDADLDPTYLSRIERGKQQASIQALHALARTLGLRDLARQLDPYMLNRPDGHDLKTNGSR
jgi:transcriptional regulator with XRE-family HTH domain